MPVRGEISVADMLILKEQRMDPAHFYTGIVVDAYARLKASSFEADLYRDFVVAHGQPGLEIGCGEGQPLLDLRSGGLEVEGVRLLSGHA